jgi:UDP-N-acetylglucosamine--N-acetylmuramyl-(pentapeptide) pyrophosphoryl-undecaprenol N-acetylglucosamine transferase
VFTTGGYIAAPAILGARWCGIPAVLHESNAIPGRVTRLLGRFSAAVAVGLPVAAGRIPGCRPVLTGTPVRSAFLIKQPLPDWVPAGPGPLLVVMGGSQGALGPQPHGACRASRAVGTGLSGGASHGGQRSRRG